MTTRTLGSTLLPALVLVLAMGAQDAPAQATAIPDLRADSWPVPHGGYAHFRLLLANGSDRVHGGALKVAYTIACTLQDGGGTCPGTAGHRAETTIPCGESESGGIAINLNRTPYRTLNQPYTLTLTIQEIVFADWSPDTIRDLNQRHGWRHRINEEGRVERFQEDVCSTGSYRPARVMHQSSDWDAVVTVTR